MSGLPAAAAELLRRERGAAVAAVHPVAGGVNSEAWEVGTASGERYLVKRYPPAARDGVDRLGTEMAALRFLAGHGVRAVPEPVAALPEEGVGIFGFVPGRRLAPGEVGEAEVRAAAGFLAQLDALRSAPGAAAIPAAREACFSLAAHEALVRGRVERLRGRAREAGQAELAVLLERELSPLLEEAARRAADGAARLGLHPAAELPAAARILSPSDFGFHNAIRRPDGGLVFIDFEYFGWDDPAKTVADFFLQPAVPVPARFAGAFLAAVAGFVAPQARLVERLPLLRPLLAVKWCTILLNPFLRPGATPAQLGHQLAKARAHAARLGGELAGKAFPFPAD